MYVCYIFKKDVYLASQKYIFTSFTELIIYIAFFSAHGTYIGNVRLEKHKPTQLPVDSSFHFGASTRKYLIRERPQAGPRPIMEELERSAASDSDGRLMGLPETESELDNLTEFNTAHNRRITMIGKYVFIIKNN